MSIRGSLDVVASTMAMGWAYSSEIGGKLTVQALLNNAVIGEAIADLHRADLAAVGLGDGNCGYQIEFYREVDPLYLPFIVVKLDGGDLDLPRSTASGYSDFFSAFYRKHPVTGRHRSVFGGLWTDRIDAAAVLKGRIDVGLIAPHIAALVSNFLRAGFVIVKQAQQRGTASEPSAGLRHGESVAIGSVRGKTPEPGELISSVLESKCLLDLLHPILEGPPLALSIDIVEGSDEGFRQPSSIEALPSPAECLALIVSVGDASVDLEVVRDSHLFPEFTPSGQSRWDSTSNAMAIDVAVRHHGMIDRYVVEPDSVVIVGPGLIHRVCTEAGTAALRVLCTPARHAPLDRMLAGSRKEIVLDSGARIWG